MSAAAVAAEASFPATLCAVLCRDHAASLSAAVAAAPAGPGRVYADHVRRSAVIRQQLWEEGHAAEAAWLETLARAALAPPAFQNGAVA